MQRGESLQVLDEGSKVRHLAPLPKIHSADSIGRGGTNLPEKWCDTNTLYSHASDNSIFRSKEPKHAVPIIMKNDATGSENYLRVKHTLHDLLPSKLSINQNCRLVSYNRRPSIGEDGYPKGVKIFSPVSSSSKLGFRDTSRERKKSPRGPTIIPRPTRTVEMRTQNAQKFFDRLREPKPPPKIKRPAKANNRNNRYLREQRYYPASLREVKGTAAPCNKQKVSVCYDAKKDITYNRIVAAELRQLPNIELHSSRDIHREPKSDILKDIVKQDLYPSTPVAQIGDFLQSHTDTIINKSEETSFQVSKSQRPDSFSRNGPTVQETRETYRQYRYERVDQAHKQVCGGDKKDTKVSDFDLCLVTRDERCPPPVNSEESAISMSTDVEISEQDPQQVPEKVPELVSATIKAAVMSSEAKLAEAMLLDKNPSGAAVRETNLYSDKNTVEVGVEENRTNNKGQESNPTSVDVTMSDPESEGNNDICYTSDFEDEEESNDGRLSAYDTTFEDVSQTLSEGTTDSRSFMRLMFVFCIFFFGFFPFV